MIPAPDWVILLVLTAIALVFAVLVFLAIASVSSGPTPPSIRRVMLYGALAGTCALPIVIVVANNLVNNPQTRASYIQSLCWGACLGFIAGGILGLIAGVIRPFKNLPTFRFAIRDVLWLTVAVGLSVGWWVDHRRAWEIARAERRNHIAAERRARKAEEELMSSIQGTAGPTREPSTLNEP